MRHLWSWKVRRLNASTGLFVALVAMLVFVPPAVGGSADNNCLPDGECGIGLLEGLTSTGFSVPLTSDTIRTTDTSTVPASWELQFYNDTLVTVAHATLTVNSGYPPAELVLNGGSPVSSIPLTIAHGNVASAGGTDDVISSGIDPSTGEPWIPVTERPACNWTRSVSPFTVPVGGGDQTYTVAVQCTDPAVVDVHVSFSVQLSGVTVLSSTNPDTSQGAYLQGPSGDIATGYGWDLGNPYGAGNPLGPGGAPVTGKTYVFSVTVHSPNPSGSAFGLKPDVFGVEDLELCGPGTLACDSNGSFPAGSSSFTFAEPTLDGGTPGAGSIMLSTGSQSYRWLAERRRLVHKIDLAGGSLPTSTDQCKNGGWQDFQIFKNQGDCVSYVASKGKNPPG